MTSGTSIRGFTVVTVIYPNHAAPDGAPYSARELAMLLARSMDNNWFVAGSPVARFALTDLYPGQAAGRGVYGFDFGPHDDDRDDFEARYTVLVRETTGGGFMLLAADEAQQFVPRLLELYKALPEGGDGIAAEEIEI